MNAYLIPHWESVARPVVGMVHLLPLPGSPGFGGDLEAVVDRALSDAELLIAGGVHGLMMENFGDSPFFPDRVPAHVIAHMTRIAALVQERCDVPLGINVLRNDGRSALAVAHAVGAAFIRVNVLCGARVADQGILHGIAHDLLRDRELLAARDIRILADVNVKHSSPLGPGRPVEDEVADMCGRGGADGVIVSGGGTGRAVNIDELRAVKAAARSTPVFVGSGVSAETIESLSPHADGFIVGSSLKTEGRAVNAVDPARVRDLVGRLK